MPRYEDETLAVRVYTVCDESRCKAMDEADSDQFTDVYGIQFRLVTNARKLDEYAFLRNRLNVSYAPEFETLSDTKDKLESRGREVLGRLNPGRSKGSTLNKSGASTDPSLRAIRTQTDSFPQHVNSSRSSKNCLSLLFRDPGESQLASHVTNPPLSRISSDQEYFPSQSMNQTVKMVREKLNKVQSSGEHLQDERASKKTQVWIVEGESNDFFSSSGDGVSSNPTGSTRKVSQGRS